MAKSKAALARLNEEVRERLAAIEELDGDLLREFEELAGNIRNNARTAVKFYYDFGKRANQIHSDEHRYGAKAMEKISRALGLSKGFVYKMVSLATRFTWDQVSGWCDRQTVGKRALTWSHLSEMLSIREDKEFLALLERVFAEDLSVHDVRDIMTEKAARGAAGPRSGVPKTLTGGLSQMISLSTHVNQKFAGDWEDVVFAGLQDIDGGEVTEDLLTKVASALTSLEALQEKVDEKAAELKQLNKQLTAAAKERAREAEREAKAIDRELELARKEEAAEAARKEKEKARKGPEKEAEKDSKPERNGHHSNGAEQPTGRRRERRPIEA